MAMPGWQDLARLHKFAMKLGKMIVQNTRITETCMFGVVVVLTLGQRV